MFGNIKKILQRFNLRQNNKPLVFLVCLLIASVLWMVKAMEKQYETTISMPVQYTNLPGNEVPVNTPPSRLNVKLRANGFTLLQHKFRLTISPINLNVRMFTNNVSGKNNTPDFFVLTYKYISQISNQINSEITILDISPDTLFFHFNKPTGEKIKVTEKENHD